MFEKEKFVTNKKFVEKLGLVLSGNVKQDNKLVNSFLLESVGEKFVKYLKINGKFKKFTLSPISFEIGFCEQLWSQMTLGEKLQLMKWASEDYLQTNGYGTDFPDFIFFSEYNFDNLAYTAMSLKGKIFLSLDFVSKTSGYDAYIIAIHESIHELDFVRVLKIIENDISKYIFQFKGIENFRTLRELMKLPVEGKIINWQTGQYEFVDEELRQKILLCKNSIITISRLKNTPSARKYVKDSADFDRYLSSDFYYLSPLESRAYNESIKHIFTMAIYNAERIDYSENDLKVLQSYNDFLLKINGRKREIQKHFKMPASYAVNMELEYLFNRFYYGNATMNYICQKHMTKRAEAIRYFWDMKHSGKGDYVSPFQREMLGSTETKKERT